MIIVSRVSDVAHEPLGLTYNKIKSKQLIQTLQKVNKQWIGIRKLVDLSIYVALMPNF